MQSLSSELSVAEQQVLVVGPDRAALQRLDEVFAQDCHVRHRLTAVSSLREALARIRRGGTDLVLIDRRLIDDRERDYLCWAHRFGIDLPLIVFGRRSDGPAVVTDAATDFLSLDELTLPMLQRSIRHVRDLQRREQRIRRLIDFDDLTGVPSRQLFYRSLLARMERARASGRQVGLLLANLDGYKKVSNSLGQRVGDLTLLEAVTRFRAALEPGQELARYGEDQLVVALSSHFAEHCLARLVERLATVLQRPYEVEGRNIILGCSMGGAVFPAGARDLDELLRQAGTAMHLAKKQRGCSYRLFADGLDMEVANQIALEPQLFQALRAGEFRLFYQPRIDLRSGRLAGAEALIRWQHPTRGLLSPGEFVPMAEKTGLIVPMGYWTVHRACEDIKRLDRLGLRLGRVGINLSFRQFQDATLVPTIGRILSTSGIDPARIEFELTETAMLADEQHVSHCLHQLSQLGVTFSLDDFGTGFSSFAHLQKLPINALKVDRSFVQGVDRNSEDAEIVRAIINLAHNLRKEVVAEGAETQAQIAFLREQGCDQLQGYYFCPPLPLEQLCDFDAHYRRCLQAVRSCRR